MEFTQKEMEYHYDIGYYEGIRNVLQIIHHNLLMRELSEQERVDLLLKEVGNELDDAIQCQRKSEHRFFSLVD
jgi:hypothetical protein